MAILLCAAAASHAIAQPANDACTDAIEVVCPAGGGSVTVSGTTTDATLDGTVFCGTSNTAPGVWYKVTHDGFLTASTCNAANYDTKISVYEDGCGTLGCVAGNDDTAGCGGFTTELSWPVDGSESLILVHGFGGATGDFDLTVTCDDAVENDVCEDSIGPLAVGSVTSGSTTGATLDEPPDIDFGTAVTAPGVWYTVTGTGNTMTASTCNDGNPATGGANYDSKISVYYADCENPECIGGQDDDLGNCSGFSTNFSWPTQAGKDYQVLVHGFGSATGDFDLAILDDGVPSTGANDCDGVPEEFDFCPDTEIPESVPTSGELGDNRFALVTEDGDFDTGDDDDDVSFSIEDTAGCSCEQIVDALGLDGDDDDDGGHLEHGCSIGVMEDWLALLDGLSCGDCVEPHAGIGCETAECQAAICIIDPYCCDVAWDSICAGEAFDLCVPDICIALPSRSGFSAGIEGGRTSLPEPEPVSKVPVPQKE